MTHAIHGLYAIADSTYLSAGDFVTAVHAALRGGARIVQYRDKTTDPAVRARLARDLAVLCRPFEAPFLVNDDIALAATSGASGVHLGRDDPEVALARAILGEQALIGVSCYDDLDRARAAQSAGADYVAFGRFFPSRTKPQAMPATLDLLHAARSELHIPVVAIGGITAENGGALVEAGADALAVIEGVFGQSDIRAAATRYAQLFN